jgi:ATPase family associated with various cellular activities (AAA)
MKGRTARRDMAAAQSVEQSWRERNTKVMMLGLRWVETLHAEQDAKDSGAAAQAYTQARAQMREDGQPAAMDQLSLLFQLAPFDEDVLLLALASQLIGKPKQLTVQAAQGLLAISNQDDALARLWDRLAAPAPLRRFQLLETSERPVAASTPLYIDERISRFLMGDDGLDHRLLSVVSPSAPEALPRKHRNTVLDFIETSKTDKPARVMLLGQPHSGRHAAAQFLAARFGLGLVELNTRALQALPDLVPVLSREFIIGQTALLIDADQVESKPLLEGPMRALETLVIIIAELRHDFTFEVPVLRLQALASADRLELWHEVLGPHSADPDHPLAALAEQFKFGPRAIAALANGGGNLWQAARDRASRDLEALADRIVPSLGWDDIVLPPEVLHDLQAAAAQVRHRSRVYDDHGFAARYPRGRGISILLAGPSGVGKTMAAEVVAKDLDLDLYRIDLARVVSKYIGETEKNLKAVFDAAELSGAVLLFDEADALFGKRSEVNDSHDRYANIEVSYLLQRMEAYAGLAILATNMKSHIDPAFLRRLRYVIDVPFPDTAARALIWQKAFPAAMPRAALDYDALSQLELPGGNITVIAINAAFLAAAEDTPLHLGHIARAARAEFRKLDRELRFNWIGVAET